MGGRTGPTAGNWVGGEGVGGGKGVCGMSKGVWEGAGPGAGALLVEEGPSRMREMRNGGGAFFLRFGEVGDLGVGALGAATGGEEVVGLDCACGWRRGGGGGWWCGTR